MGCIMLTFAPTNIAPAGVPVQQHAPLQICHPAGVERVNSFTFSEVVGIS